jgi:hypothetical protein
LRRSRARADARTMAPVAEQRVHPIVVPAAQMPAPSFSAPGELGRIRGHAAGRAVEGTAPRRDRRPHCRSSHGEDGVYPE